MTNHPDPNVILTWKDHGNKGQTAHVTIDYPTRLNVLNSVVVEILVKTFEEISQSDSLRAVILTGAGDRAFVGGADLRELAALNTKTAVNVITGIHNACQAVRDCSVPVIARIHGYCLGAGMELAASCDMRIASLDSTFGMPEVQVGVPSVIEAALLPRLIGWGKTSELILTGQNITAQEAKDYGFLERVVSAHALDTHLQEWIDDILVAAPRAIRLQKQLIRKWETLPLGQAIDAGIDSFAAAYKTDEPKTYMAPFITRNKKRTKG